MSVDQHHQEASRSVSVAVVTISDSRTEATDLGGQQIRRLLEENGHTVCHYAIVKDEPDQIRRHILFLGRDPRCQVILLSGGTGISPRDRTPDAVAPLFDRRLDGFGELFRMLSFAEIGPAAMLSRAEAGIMGQRILFCMPGSPNAIQLAMTRLVLPELGHLVLEAGRDLRPAVS